MTPRVRCRRVWQPCVVWSKAPAWKHWPPEFRVTHNGRESAAHRSHARRSSLVAAGRSPGCPAAPTKRQTFIAVVSTDRALMT